MLVGKRRKTRDDGNRRADCCNSVRVKRSPPHLATRKNLYTLKVVRPFGEHKAILEIEPKGVVESTANVPVPRHALCKTVLDRIDKIYKI